MFALAIAVLPILFGLFFGHFALQGIALGIALGPVITIVLTYGYVCLIKKEKPFDYALLHLN